MRSFITKKLDARSPWLYVSLLLGVAFVAGYAFRAVKSPSPIVNIVSVVLLAISALVVATAFSRILPNFFNWLDGLNRTLWKPNQKRVLAISALIIALLWLPVLLAGYPGFFNYDAGMGGLMQWAQIESGVYNDHHPMLHTLWLEYTVKIGVRLFGSFNAGICFSVVLQAVLLLSVIVWALSKMLQDGCSRVGFILSVAFFALNPMVSLFAFSTTKDVPCAATILVLCISLRAALREGEVGNSKHDARNTIRIVASTAICASFRSNVLIAIMLFLVVLFLSRKVMKNAKTICMYLALGILLSAVWLTSSSRLLNVEKSPIGAWNSLGIPMQCLASCTQDSDVSQPDKELLHNMLGDVEYKWNQSDYARGAFMSYGGSKIDLVKTWIKMGLKYPGVYAKAVFIHTEDAWNPFSVIDGYSDLGSDITTVFEYVTKEPGHMESKLPQLAEFYRWISLESGPERILPLSLMISIPFYLYSIVVCAARMKERSCRESYYPCLLLIIIAITNIAGPVMLMRYFLYLIFALPLVIHWTISRPSGHSPLSDADADKVKTHSSNG